jgi:signal transduction histidine kinase
MMGEISPDQKKIVTLAKKSSENMLDMIQNLLDVAKMEEGKLELKKEEFDLKIMAAERKQEFETLVKNERKTISVEIAGEIPMISAEKHLIERVINNLISNAVHHTSSGGKIFVGIKKIEGFVEVSVSDDGAGIPPEYLDKIFEKFVQVDRRKAQLRTGAGLGLTFCRMVVETHGGKIRVESELNKGSAFIFTLPV